jgi:hypothetical protein
VILEPLLAKHCTEITLTPEGQTYQLSGDWNLWADFRMVPEEGSGPNVCQFDLSGWLLLREKWTTNKIP